MEKNSVVKSIYNCLVKQTEDNNIEEKIWKQIAEEVANDMNDYGIDERWKDYIQVDVTEDQDIYVSAGQRDIDFDKNGLKTGSGMLIMPIDAPWEKES